VSEYNEIPEDVADIEVTFKDGVTHRVPVTPEQAGRWLKGEEALGMGRGEPTVDRDGRLVEHHGLPEDPDVEPVEPEVLGVLDPKVWEAHDHDADVDAYPDEL